MGGLTKSVKKVTGIAGALGNPGGSAIRAIRGQPIVGGNSNTFGARADPLNAFHAAPAQTTNYDPASSGLQRPIQGPFIDPRTNMAPGAGQPMNSMNQQMNMQAPQQAPNFGGGQLPVSAGPGGKNLLPMPQNQMPQNPQAPPPNQPLQQWGITPRMPGGAM